MLPIFEGSVLGWRAGGEYLGKEREGGRGT